MEKEKMNMRFGGMMGRAQRQNDKLYNNQMNKSLNIETLKTEKNLFDLPMKNGKMDFKKSESKIISPVELKSKRRQIRRMTRKF
jgi:hypothetical protein